MSGGERPRLAPWSGEDGKPCYLVTDDDCRLSRLADRMEDEQLAIGVRLLDFASDLVTDGSTHPHEMRFLARRLSEALRDALRVADSRGDRLPRVDRAAAPPRTPTTGVRAGTNAAPRPEAAEPAPGGGGVRRSPARRSTSTEPPNSR